MTMENGAVQRAMRDGVPDGPDVRCGTCDLWDYVCDVRGRDGRRALDIGICTRAERDVAVLNIEGSARQAVLTALTGEYDGSGCTRWREYRDE